MFQIATNLAGSRAQSTKMLKYPNNDSLEATRQQSLTDFEQSVYSNRRRRYNFVSIVLGQGNVIDITLTITTTVFTMFLLQLRIQIQSNTTAHSITPGCANACFPSFHPHFKSAVKELSTGRQLRCCTRGNHCRKTTKLMYGNVVRGDRSIRSNVLCSNC